MARKCENWLTTFSEWTLPRSEAPESYVFWTGLYTLAAALRRRVKVPKSILGSWECPPHLYVMFIAPPGEARKTTTMGYAIELLEPLTHVMRGPSIVTQAALLSKLVESEDSSLYLTSEEFSDLIRKSGNEMFEFLTSMFDGKRSIEASTIGRGVEFAEKPCINMIAATTPQWIGANMGEEIIGGGFASRVIFLYEETVRRRQLYYRNKIDFKHLEKLKEKLTEDLAHISILEGDFDIDRDAEEFMERWYQTYEPPNNKNLKGYYQRKPAHLHKVAMLLHLAYSDELVLTKADFEAAHKIVQAAENRMPKVFESVGKNPFTFDMRTILEFVMQEGSVPKKKVLEHFMAVATPAQLEDLINGLQAMGLLKCEMKDKELMLRAAV